MRPLRAATSGAKSMYVFVRSESVMAGAFAEVALPIHASVIPLQRVHSCNCDKSVAAPVLLDSRLRRYRCNPTTMGAVEQTWRVDASWSSGLGAAGSPGRGPGARPLCHPNRGDRCGHRCRPASRPRAGGRHAGAGAAARSDLPDSLDLWRGSLPTERKGHCLSTGAVTPRHWRRQPRCAALAFSAASWRRWLVGPRCGATGARGKPRSLSGQRRCRSGRRERADRPGPQAAERLSAGSWDVGRKRLPRPAADLAQAGRRRGVALWRLSRRLVERRAGPAGD